MLQEVENRFREGAERFNRGDIDAALEDFDPNVIFEPQVAVMDGSYTGHDGLKRFFNDFADLFVVARLEYSEVRDLEDRVLALGTLRTVGKGSGIEQVWPVAVVATLRAEDGLVTHWKDYGNKDQALEALGLSE
jgi:ketosteroid isomerase-like protein